MCIILIDCDLVKTAADPFVCFFFRQMRPLCRSKLLPLLVWTRMKRAKMKVLRVRLRMPAPQCLLLLLQLTESERVVGIMRGLLEGGAKCHAPLMPFQKKELIWVIRW